MLLHFLFIGYDFYYYLQLCAVYILLLLVYYFWCSSSGKLYVMEILIKFIYRDISRNDVQRRVYTPYVWWDL